MSTSCECGRRKTYHRDEACPSCMRLDGRRAGAASGILISALRVLGGAATYEALYEEIGTPGGDSQRSAVQHCVRRLRRDGRLYVRIEDGNEPRVLVLR